MLFNRNSTPYLPSDLPVLGRSRVLAVPPTLVVGILPLFFLRRLRTEASVLPPRQCMSSPPMRLRVHLFALLVASVVPVVLLVSHPRVPPYPCILCRRRIRPLEVLCLPVARRITMYLILFESRGIATATVVLARVRLYPQFLQRKSRFAPPLYMSFHTSLVWHGVTINRSKLLLRRTVLDSRRSVVRPARRILQ